jgi:hypothetical protein
MPRLHHGARADFQDDRLSAASPDLGGSVSSGREVNIVPLHRAQALALDRGQKPPHRTVIEPVRRSRDRQRQVDFDTVAPGWA